MADDSNQPGADATQQPSGAVFQPQTPTATDGMAPTMPSADTTPSVDAGLPVDQPAAAESSDDLLPPADSGMPTTVGPNDPPTSPDVTPPTPPPATDDGTGMPPQSQQ